MVQSSIFQHGHAAGWEKVGSGVRRQVLGYDDKVMLDGLNLNRAAAAISYRAGTATRC